MKKLDAILRAHTQYFVGPDYTSIVASLDVGDRRQMLMRLCDFREITPGKITVHSPVINTVTFSTTAAGVRKLMMAVKKATGGKYGSFSSSSESAAVKVKNLTGLVKAMYSKFPDIAGLGIRTDLGSGDRYYLFEDRQTRLRLTVNLSKATFNVSNDNDARISGITTLLSSFGITQAPVTRIPSFQKGASESAGVNRAAPTYKQIVSQQAKFCKNSGATVEYSRAEGSYFIECDGDTIELRNDDAEEFGKTVKKYMSYNISEHDAQLAAAWPWVQNM